MSDLADITPILRDRLPHLRGVLKAHVPMAPFSWFRAGGVAQAFYEPMDEADLALLMAGLDGVKNEMDPGAPLDKDIYGMTPEELKDIPKMPGSLDEALECLRKDHAFLLRGGVFTPDVIEHWIRYKRQREVAPMRRRPHPYEFFLYYDA